MKTILNNAILCSTDYNYIGYLKKFLNSVNKAKVNADIFVRLVDFTVDQVNEIKLEYDFNAIIERPNLCSKKNILKDVHKAMHYTYGVDLLKTGRKNIKKLLYSERGVYTCHSRFKTINSLLEKGYKNILSLDVDTLIINDINHIFKNLEDDLYVVPQTESDQEYYFHNEGLLLIKNTNSSKKFFKDVENYIFYNERWKGWNIDTEALESSYKNNNISLGFLSDRYKDREFRDDAYMWSGDSINKYNEKFCK